MELSLILDRKDMGATSKIIRLLEHSFITQQEYVEKMLMRFNMENCKERRAFGSSEFSNVESLSVHLYIDEFVFS